jgi:glycosyltransferase involved in cell wall biosynthesis
LRRRIITVSYTGLDAGGGVPKFNRDLHSAFPDRECRHFCWDDFPWHPSFSDSTEWGRARGLNSYLVASKQVTVDDVVVADGFWADGLEHLPFAISHSHGIWSHLTHDDVMAGKAPDMPMHHAAQVTFRRRWTGLGKHITAVSEFIADQMRLQWGFEVDRVINNGVDTELYRPWSMSGGRFDEIDRPLIVHGVNDPSNANKGWDHIELLREEVRAGRLNGLILSLDEAHAWFERISGRSWSKAYVLGQADLVVHPSAYEGNSMFVAESLSCGLPVVGYDVGFLYSLSDGPLCSVMKRSDRSPAYTLDTVRWMLSDPDRLARASRIARTIATQHLSIDLFRRSWRSYIGSLEDVA